MQRLNETIRQCSFINLIDFNKRKSDIEEFNRNNRWRKRGIAFVPMEYPQPYFGMIPIVVAIYPNDGTVSGKIKSIDNSGGCLIEFLKFNTKKSFTWWRRMWPRHQYQSCSSSCSLFGHFLEFDQHQAYG